MKVLIFQCPYTTCMHYYYCYYCPCPITQVSPTDLEKPLFLSTSVHGSQIWLPLRYIYRRSLTQFSSKECSSPFHKMPDYVYKWYFCFTYFEAQIELPDSKKGTWNLLLHCFIPLTWLSPKLRD